jgi:hypothetical protein
MGQIIIAVLMRQHLAVVRVNLRESAVKEYLKSNPSLSHV